MSDSKTKPSENAAPRKAYPPLLNELSPAVIKELERVQNIITKRDFSITEEELTAAHDFYRIIVEGEMRHGKRCSNFGDHIGSAGWFKRAADHLEMLDHLPTNKTVSETVSSLRASSAGEYYVTAGILLHDNGEKELASALLLIGMGDEQVKKLNALKEQKRF